VCDMMETMAAAIEGLALSLVLEELLVHICNRPVISPRSYATAPDIKDPRPSHAC
jgi:hypothetical protein